MNFGVIGFEWDLPIGAKLQPRKKDSITDYFPSVIQWFIFYRLTSFSIYYDPDDSMGYMGEPYFEIYDFNEVERFTLKESKRMFKHIQALCDRHDEHLETNPEVYL